MTRPCRVGVSSTGIYIVYELVPYDACIGYTDYCDKCWTVYHHTVCHSMSRLDYNHMIWGFSPGHIPFVYFGSSVHTPCVFCE